MSNLAQRPTYTDEQLDLFLGKLGPQQQPPLTLTLFQAEIQEDSLKALSKLQRLAAAFIPWNSVTLHYSTPPHTTVLLDADVLYHKIVERQLGGYCLESNTFFFIVLRSLGYDCYLTGARISKNLVYSVSTGDGGGDTIDDFGGWAHEVIIVNLKPSLSGGGGVDARRYIVDIGLGAQCAIEPLLMEEGATARSIPGLTQRLVRRSIAPFTKQDHTIWVIQIHRAQRDSPGNADADADADASASAGANADADDTGDAGWINACCFDENEWLPQDFGMLNYQISRDPMSLFNCVLVATKPILDSSGAGRVLGIYILVKDTIIKRGDGGKKEVLRVCQSESDRVDALARWFAMQLTPEEVAGIRGRSTEIKALPPA